MFNSHHDHKKSRHHRAMEPQNQPAHTKGPGSEQADYQERLRRLATEVTLVEERERHQLALMLHDKVGQNLALVKLKIFDLKDRTLTAETLAELDELLEEAVQQVRSLTVELSPPLLYDFGLEVAVRALCEEYGKRHGLAMTFEEEGEPAELDDTARVLLYQSVRELLMNVVKHAAAKRVAVSIHHGSHELKITVEDDGRGFSVPPEAGAPGGGTCFGLFSIRERVRQIGGSFELVSRRGKGCRVVLSVPFHGNATGRDR